MRLSELLGLRVRTEAGRQIGVVHDVRARLTGRALRPTALVVGPLGVLERLGLGGRAVKNRPLRHDVVVWSDVVRIDRDGVVVRGEVGADG